MAIDDFVNEVEKEAKELERDLYDEIISVIIGLLTIDGKTVFNEKNIYLIGKVDRAFNAFDKNFQQPYFKKILKHLKGLDKFYVNYFSEMGLDAKAFKGFEALIGRMESYLNSVAVLDPVKLEVKNFLMGAISQGRSMGSIRMGLRSILGLKDRSGSLNRYYRAFIFDSLMQFDRILSNAHARQNNLNYFQYKGGLIETSRDFCIARNDLVFRREQANEWKDDPTLPGYPDVATYDPLVDCGRWNCRHYLLFLTDEQAKELNK
jgi:hypothetical protein